MTALACVLTPLDPGNAIELAGGLWRKRVLPVGDVEYPGEDAELHAFLLGPSPRHSSPGLMTRWLSSSRMTAIHTPMIPSVSGARSWT